MTQREADPARAGEALVLMALALERAAEDAGSRALLARADSIRAPRGFWSYPDPCRLLAERFGASGARTEIAEFGVLQTTLLGRAAADIAAGRADVVLVAGGEARHRMQRARAAGVDAPVAQQAAVAPDSVLRPHAPILSAREVRAGLAMPVLQYAMLENALRAAEGLSLEAHRAEAGGALGRALGAGPGESRRLVAGARQRGGDRRRQPQSDAGLPVRKAPLLAMERGSGGRAGGVYARDGARARHPARTLDLPARCGRCEPHGSLHRAPRAPPLRRLRARCRARVRARGAGAWPSVAHRELYSCFPSAVRVQLRELCDRGPAALQPDGRHGVRGRAR